MNRSLLRMGLPAGGLFCAILLASTPALPQTISTGPPNNSVISLVPQAGNTASAASGEAASANAPANFHNFASAQVGESAYPDQLTLRFSAPTTLTGIESSNDFTIEQGSTCKVDGVYSAGDSCALLVRFTPQGAGRRTGHLTIANTASAQPALIGLGGTGFAPVLSFIPALITTVPGTLVSGTGLLNGATNMTVDGGDIVYIADPGNSKVRTMDSSGTLGTTANSPIVAPVSLAVDSFGIIYTTNVPGHTYYFSIYYPYGSETAFGYAYTPSTCTPSAPCAFASVGMSNPANISIDPFNNLFMEEGTEGALEMPVAGISGGSGTLNLWYLSDQFSYSSGSPAAFAVDGDDNLYTYYNFSTFTCFILRESVYNAEHSPTATRVVGGTKCGFSGDGGQAGSAEIGNKVGQITFDLAGNMYFTDTQNNRLRRVDQNTGIITTLAGTGPGGNGGDGGPSTSANLNAPTGVAVDSQGQVYVISVTHPGPTQQIRKIGTTGLVNFSGSQTVGTTSVVNMVTVSNTGNSTLTLTNAAIAGANPNDFVIDKNTTSCNLAAGGTLFSGQSCTVGFRFTPTGAGARAAYLALLDNTVTSSNYIQLGGTGVAGPTTAPAVKLSSSVNPAKTCRSLVFSIAVEGGGALPTGTVVLQSGSKVLAKATLSAGQAKVSASALKKGENLLNASYQGNALYSAAVSPTLTQMVSKGCKQSKK